MGSEWKNSDYENNRNGEGSDFNGYTGQDYAFETLMRNGRPKTFGWSVASMVMGIISVVCCALGWTGLILGAAAIAFSIISRRKLGYFDGMSVAGLILGIFGFVFGVSLLIAVNFLITEEMMQELLEEYYKQLEDLENGGNGGLGGNGI